VLQEHFLKFHSVVLLSMSALMSACSPSPVSWERLLSIKIAEQYPGYQVQTLVPDTLTVVRPGRDSKTIDVKEIANYCQRGVADCNWIMDQMLLSLQ
jgi:hypothetical protein